MRRLLVTRGWAYALLMVLGFTAVAFCTRYSLSDTDSDSVTDGTTDAIKRSAKDEAEYYELLKMFVDTLDQVERNYAKQISRRELVDAAIRGMLSRLDAHSNYIPSENLDDFQRDITSQFGGIGIRIDVQGERPIIISPLVGTPAYRAGLVAGDRIMDIEGESTKGLNTDEIVKRLKGPAGSEVTIKVFHPYNRELEDVTLRREVINIETILGHSRNDDDSWQFMYDTDAKIGYVRMSAFSTRTARELRSALKELTRQGMQALVLDLRHNPGGLLSAAVAVSDLFVSNGLIVSTDGRNIRKESWHARARGTFEGFPMAVLVNRFSASGSEIVAACLQDHERAIVIGERTFGKGSVQQVMDLARGQSALKLTTGSYQRPSGTNIHRFDGASQDDDWGVIPNDGYGIRLSGFEMRRLWNHWLRNSNLKTKQDEDEPKAEAESSDSDSPEDDSSESKSEEEPPTDQGDRTEFIDRQLQKAIGFLRDEIAANDSVADSDGL